VKFMTVIAVVLMMWASPSAYAADAQRVEKPAALDVELECARRSVRSGLTPSITGSAVPRIREYVVVDSGEGSRMRSRGGRSAKEL
jgi:hypothetical protein